MFNTQSEKLKQLKQQIYAKKDGVSTSIAIPAINTQITETKKVPEVSDKSVNNNNRYSELPDFCKQLPSLMKDAMITLKDLHNTPYELSLVTLLGAINSATQSRYNVDSLIYKVRPTSMYLMVILDTAGGKSTLWGEVKGPFEEYQDRMMEAFRNEDARYASEMKKYNSKVAKYEKDYEAGLNPIFPDRPMPAETANYVQSSFTAGGVTDTLVSQPMVSIISDEAGEFFSSHAFQGGKQDGNRATEMTSLLTKFWDASQVQRNTRETRITVKNRRVNMFFMVQARVIRDILNNKLFAEQGFTHRILIARIQDYEKPDMKVDTKSRLETEKIRKQLDKFNNRLREILDIRLPLIPEKNFELQPIIIKMNDDAAEILAAFYNNTKNYGKSDNILEEYAGFAGRLHEHSIRLAATLAAFEHRTIITKEDAQSAKLIMDYFIKERSELDLGIEDINPNLTRGANMFRNWWKTHMDFDGTLNDLRKNGPGFQRSISAEQREELIMELLKNEDIIAYETVTKNNKTVKKFKFNKRAE